MDQTSRDFDARLAIRRATAYVRQTFPKDSNQQHRQFHYYLLGWFGVFGDPSYDLSVVDTPSTVSPSAPYDPGD